MGIGLVGLAALWVDGWFSAGLRLASGGFKAGLEWVRVA